MTHLSTRFLEPPRPVRPLSFLPQNTAPFRSLPRFFCREKIQFGLRTYAHYPAPIRAHPSFQSQPLVLVISLRYLSFLRGVSRSVFRVSYSSIVQPFLRMPITVAHRLQRDDSSTPNRQFRFHPYPVPSVSMARAPIAACSKNGTANLSIEEEWPSS